MRFSCYNNLTCPILLASIWFDIKSISVFVPNAWRIKKKIEYGDWMKEEKGMVLVVEKDLGQEQCRF